MNIGIIGAGAIATYVLDELAIQTKTPIHVRSLLVRDRTKYADLAARHQVELYTEMDDFLSSDIDVVVEAANIDAVKELLPTIIRKKKVVIISIGAFVDRDFYTEMLQLAQDYQRKIYLPSGAIGGLDLIQNAAATGTLTNVSLETRKPAHTLVDEFVKHERVIFNGTAAAAIQQFPKNINVAIALGMAGLGLEQTNVTIIADPNVNRNLHTITTQGAFGKATFQIENEALPTNSRTSYLAAMSVIGTLKRCRQQIQIGM